MKKLLFRALFILVPSLWSVYASAQPKKEKDCSTTCFSSKIISTEKISNTCTLYEVKVSTSGECAHALSHFSVAIPCGVVQNVWNSENWKQEIGTDPTTGISGFKIDDISNFGEGPLSFFTVKFTLCASDENCANQLLCWQPQVGYKASTCVNYETLAANCKSLKASLEKKDISCYGAEDGYLRVVIESGNEPYTFLWSDNSTGESISAVDAGSYSVLLRDATGAELTLQETLEQPLEINVSGTTYSASCNGVADGSIDLSVSGGMGDYTFKWSNGVTTEDVQSLVSGLYSVAVTDSNNCSAVRMFTIANISAIGATATIAKPDCNQSNGSIELSLTGGTAPYTFRWSNDAVTQDVSAIGAGLYTVAISDNSGCSVEKSFIVREENTLSLKATTTPTGCTDVASGAIDLMVSGGTEPYTFKWSSGQTTGKISGLPIGLYTVTVTDSKGCTITASYLVSKTTFNVPRNVVQPTCNGELNGSITLQDPIGGTGPYTYVWSNGETGTFLTGLAPGTYSVIVTDATGCSKELTDNIINPSEIALSAAISNAGDCNSDGSFSIDLSASGGSEPYSYLWSNGSTTQDLSGLYSGAYTIIVTDANGCSTTKEITIEGESSELACVIAQLPATPVCASLNNTLSTTVVDADSYSWSVASTDGKWTLTGDTSTPSVSFTTGGQNSSATFTLTVTRNGCTQVCAYTVSACAPDDNGEGTDPGEEDPGTEEPGGGEPGEEEPGKDPGDTVDETCEGCFGTVARLIETSGECRTYEMEVNTNGLCRHDLSHWTLAIPCGSVSNFSNSEGWKMEYGKDPTTGLFGLKVDDITRFGKDKSAFTVRFTLCASSCDLSYWDPTVAYKAGQCVAIETIDISQATSSVNLVSVYPNPFNEMVRFEWNAIQEHVSLEIIDQYGNTVSRSTKPTGKSESYYINLESSALPKGMYYYRLTIDGQLYNGKISKR